MRQENINENEVNSSSQTRRILAYLKDGNKITPLEALEKFGTLRLGARIADIKALGYDVKSEFVTAPSGKKVKSYWI